MTVHVLGFRCTVNDHALPGLFLDFDADLCDLRLVREEVVA
jgi:hypothetical protein